ncbi:hypothetical protein V8F20_011414 [Naviculisporaceae sp. PSN 640]
MAPVPLDDFREGFFQLDLAQALWSWKLCGECAQRTGKTCLNGACDGQRVSVLERYFKFYQAMVSNYLEVTPSSKARFKTHQDVFSAIQRLRSNPDLSMEELCSSPLIGDRSFETIPRSHEEPFLVARLLLMVEPSPMYHSSHRLEKGIRRIHWEGCTPFSKFVQDIFPVQNHPVLSSRNADAELLADMKSDLRATKLIKSLGVRFEATHDISSHLRYNRKTDVIEIFHHVAFLKEQLRATKGTGDCTTPYASIKRGALPRPLVLEVLDSIQGIMFPLCDRKSRKLLKSLVQSNSFDPEVLNFEFGSIRNPGEDDIPYVYLADRLSDIYNELQNPRPRTWLERQMERKSGARYMMMATLIGVIFAVLLGMASLAVSACQTWIAYQAWQHPVAPP